MSNIPESPERNAPDPILPEPIGEDGFVQPREPDEAPGQGESEGSGRGGPNRDSPPGQAAER